MTREEIEKATELIINLMQQYASTPDDLWACEVAIKALEQKPCSNAIDRSEAIKIASGYCHFSNVAKELAKLPPVTPEPKTGHWIKDDITERSKSAYKHKCDRCGAYHRAMYDYCPSCGARMFEPQESEE